MTFPALVPSARLRVLFPIALVVLAAMAILVRALTIAEPLGIDQGLWASAVRGLARGQRLYRDVWEQRPPGIYLTYLAAFSVLGWTTAAVAWLDVAASAVMTFLVYVLGRALGGRTAGALAAALFALMTMPAWLYRYGGLLQRSVCETFIIVCVGLAALCAMGLRRPRAGVWAFGTGFWIGAAIVYKPNAALYLPALMAWGMWAAPPADGRGKPRLLASLAAAGLGACVIPALTVFWIWQVGVTSDAWTAVVDFNRWYVGLGFTPSAYAVRFSNEVYLRMKTEPLWLAGGVASCVAVWDLLRNRRLPPLPALAVLWGAASVLVIVVNGMWLFNTYFIHALPPLALLATWWLTAGAAGSRVRKVLVAATVVAMAAQLYQRNYLDKVIDWATADAAALTGRLDRTAYLDRFGGYDNQRGYSARANEQLAAYVRAHTQADDRVFLFGINGADVYFLADRLPAQRFLRANFFVAQDFPDPRFRLDAVVAELRSARPRYLIFEQLHTESQMGVAVDALPQNPLIRSLLEAYDLDTQIEDFTLYRLR